MNVMEEWKDIDGYEGLYQISNLGRVRRLPTEVINSFGVRRFFEGGILNPTNSQGYLIVDLSRGGFRKHYLIHRLVAQAFLENPNSLPFVNHKDENKSNNTVDNLEWCTPQYNTNYGTSIERRSNSHRGKKHKFSHHKKQWKAVSKYSKDGEFICTYPSMTIAAAETGNKVQNISNACIKGCKCGGFYWTRE